MWVYEQEKEWELSLVIKSKGIKAGSSDIEVSKEMAKNEEILVLEVG